MGAIKNTKVIDYIGDDCIFFGDEKSWYGIWCLSVQEASSALGMLSPWLPGTYIVQSSPKVQDGVSFFFKMESAWPVPFLAHHLPGSSQPHTWPRSTSQPLLSVHTPPCLYLGAALISGQWLFIEILSAGLWVCPVSFVSVSSVLQQCLEYRKVKVKSLSWVLLFLTPWTIQFMEFSRPEYWSE